MSKKIVIEATIESPIDVTSEQLREWVKFELGDIAEIPVTNPLHEIELSGNVTKLKIWTN